MIKVFRHRPWPACSPSDEGSMPPGWSWRTSHVEFFVRCSSFLFSITLLLNDVQAQPQTVPLEVPEGFEASLFCNHEMCPDIQCLTTDSQGNLVASGPGYIRVLFDTDQDGRAEQFREFASGPKTGAQGMFVDGNNLYCIGDGGLLLYRDANRDSIADGPPEVIRSFKTGGEHHTHAIRKGPDGWWYLIAGNMAGVNETPGISKNSPLVDAQAGVLFRLSPDFTQTEILADGLRNAYDFDFDAAGDLFTYDSDGERDITLPWYRPTRVFHVVAGMNHGWVSRSWKKPNYFAEMSPVLAELGRGSPTGVVCYQHDQFPKEFRGTLFVLDWTYGRVVVVKKKRQGASWIAQSKNFATAKGNYGFAPTDAVIGPAGSLYISVGGRGTQGSIFRISYNKPSAVKKSELPLEAVLNAPQPLSAWSRARWEPQVEKLGEEAFIISALDQHRSEAQRIRAIEILTEKFQGPDVDFMRSMQLEKSRDLRARSVWAYGRSSNGILNKTALKPFYHQDSPAVVRSGLEVLLNSPDELLVKFKEDIAAGLSHEDRVVRYLATQVTARMPDDGFQAVGELARQSGWHSAIQLSRAFIDRGYIGHPYAWHDIGLGSLRKNKDQQIQLSAVLMIQHALGGFGQSTRHAAVFDGYLSRVPLPQQQEFLNELRSHVAGMYPSGNDRLDWELGRLAAMLNSADVQLLDKILKRITPDSHPTSDLHHLIIAACLPGVRSQSQTQHIAQALLSLDEKIESRKLVVDSNWEPRLSELHEQLILLDQSLPVALLNSPKFGSGNHVLFINKMVGETRIAALNRYLQLVDNKKAELTPELLSLLAELPFATISPLVHQSLEDNSLRPTALLLLARANLPQDRAIILSGLDAVQWDVVSSCLFAISQWNEPTPEVLAAELNLLSRAAGDQAANPIWGETLKLIRKTALQIGTGLETMPPESPVKTKPSKPEKQAIAQSWITWASTQFPALKSKLVTNSLPMNWEEMITRIDWNTGEATRGASIYKRQQCSQCHGGRTAIGPDLRGVSNRFALRDLMIAIVDPHRNVSERYRATAIATTSGKTYTGIIIYESIDGLLLRDSTHQTIRINASDIDERTILKTSLMPENLLKNCTDQEIADLYAYLKSL